MKKHPNSTHLSIKRLRAMIDSFFDAMKKVGEHPDFSDAWIVNQFVNFVEVNRTSLSTGKPKN